MTTNPFSLFTQAEIDEFDLYSYWDNKGPDDPDIPDAETIRNILKAQGSQP